MYESFVCRGDLIYIVGHSVRFIYNGKHVSGVVDSVKVIDGKKIAPENRGKTLIVVGLDDDADDRKNGKFRSYYLHKIEKVL